MKAYKGFNEKLQCRDFQFEVGETYETDNAGLCRSGFHACENPLDVLAYYSPSDSRYCEVELEDVDAERSCDSKVCGKKITVVAEIGIKGIVSAAVNQFIENAKQSPDEISNENDERIGSAGDEARIGSSGDYARIGSAGYGARIGSSGYGARIGSVGDEARIGSAGYYARIGSAGDYARIKSEGRNSVVMCAGHGCAARGKKGSWLALTEWAIVNNESTPVCVKAVQIDGKTIREDTFYSLINGEFVEVT